jgi:steroid 5-alpha reductase family enzyme
MNPIYNTDIPLEHLFKSYIIIMLYVAAISFIISELTRNYSQVDKLWSLMPMIYSIVALVSCPTPRLWIMTFLVVIWGFRLSYNFYRKGGYNIIPWKGEEDYRWKIMRDNSKLKGRIRFGLFNLFFISLYQNIIILLFSAPLLMAAKYRSSELNLTDLIAALLMLLFIVIEAVADNQQYRFQKLKQCMDRPEGVYSESLKNGFLSEGLWRFVRHPNFMSEQAIWISFYFFSVAASGKWFNWTLAGPVMLILLFFGSTEFTERISSSKYPDYTSYKKNVPKFFPGIFRTGKIR